MAVHVCPFKELQGTEEEIVWLEIRTSFPDSALQAQEQVYVCGSGVDQKTSRLFLLDTWERANAVN